MRFTPEHEQFRATVRDFVRREIDPHVDAWEAAGMFPAHELFPKLHAIGVLGLEYDPKYGGHGADHSFTVIAGEEIGRAGCGGVPMAISVQTDMATPSLHHFGSEELKQKYLVPAIKGEMVASICVTEPDAGSDVANLRTRAVRDGDEWVINGSKIYITNAVQGDWLCLLARTSDEGGYRGMSQIVVENRTPGVTVARKLDKLGMWSSDTAELSFVDVRVPVSNTIGEIGRGFQQQMRQFQNERMIANYQAVGAIERAIEMTKEYLRDRVVFGRPLIDNQYLQFRLGECIAELDLLRAYNYSCVDAYLAGEDTTRFATIAKWKMGRLAHQVADLCLQVHGGSGYMAETWTSRFYRDSRLWAIGGGAEEVMMRTLCRLEGMPSL